MTNRKPRTLLPKKSVSAYATRKAGPLQLWNQNYTTQQKLDRIREAKARRKRHDPEGDGVDAGATGLEDLFARTTLAPAPANSGMNALTAAFGKLGGARARRSRRSRRARRGTRRAKTRLATRRKTRRGTRRAANSELEVSLAGATLAFALGGLLADSELEGGRRHKTPRRR